MMLLFSELSAATILVVDETVGYIGTRKHPIFEEIFVEMQTYSLDSVWWVLLTIYGISPDEHKKPKLILIDMVDCRNPKLIK
jgi:hypothetical protein